MCWWPECTLHRGSSAVNLTANLVANFATIMITEKTEIIIINLKCVLTNCESQYAPQSLNFRPCTEVLAGATREAKFDSVVTKSVVSN